jgi:hypothetical protein
MTDILFDRLTYIDRLKRAGISDDNARAHAEALDMALRDSVATKADVTALKAVFTALEHKIDLAVRDMTIRMGMMAVAIVAVLASLKFFT